MACCSVVRIFSRGFNTGALQRSTWVPSQMLEFCDKRAPWNVRPESRVYPPWLVDGETEEKGLPTFSCVDVR